ncbi:unnamed protein product [Schistosoma mattheei]|uniref:Uncharacterized protein n=1 Tax=Schistosoma mattheei TaxID=31246 RepID=A0A183PXE4_9TREM|nr:unnamed protein product [Schistosoma mattheei]
MNGPNFVRIGRAHAKLPHYGSSLNNQTIGTIHHTSTYWTVRKRLIVPDHIPIPLDGLKYIAPELLIHIDKQLKKLYENNCQFIMNKSKFIDLLKYDLSNHKSSTLSTIHLMNIHNIDSLNSFNYKQLMKSHFTKSTLMKSWSNLSSTIDIPKLSKYISLPNLYLSKQLMNNNNNNNNNKLMKFIRPHKMNFMKTIRQYISKSEQKNLLINCVHIPIIEFTTYTDIFAFG